jgi:hypothetical protein
MGKRKGSKRTKKFISIRGKLERGKNSIHFKYYQSITVKETKKKKSGHQTRHHQEVEGDISMLLSLEKRVYSEKGYGLSV